MPTFNDFIEKELPLDDTTKNIYEVIEAMQAADFSFIGAVKADVTDLKQKFLQPILQYKDDNGNLVYDY